MAVQHGASWECLVPADVEVIDFKGRTDVGLEGLSSDDFRRTTALLDVRPTLRKQL